MCHIPTNYFEIGNVDVLDFWNVVYHVTKPRPFDADGAWRDHVERVRGREPSQWPSNIFHTTYPFSRYPLYLVYSKRPPPSTDKYDPHRPWLSHLDRLAELDKLYPTLWPLTGSKLSPTPSKVYPPPPPSGGIPNKFDFFFCRLAVSTTQDNQSGTDQVRPCSTTY